MPVSEGKLRLGGMALRNGLLVGRYRLVLDAVVGGDLADA